jgi:hypothetical protein
LTGGIHWVEVKKENGGKTKKKRDIFGIFLGISILLGWGLP